MWRWNDDEALEKKEKPRRSYSPPKKKRKPWESGAGGF